MSVFTSKGSLAALTLYPFSGCREGKGLVTLAWASCVNATRTAAQSNWCIFLIITHVFQIQMAGQSDLSCPMGIIFKAGI